VVRSIEMNYLKLLTESYDYAKDEDPEVGKLEFLSDAIFDFTTYDGEISSTMGVWALSVCKAISDKKTFEYIKSEEGYLWYILIVNMPFFQDKLDWGGSIRGAWWGLYVLPRGTAARA
jgi:hypothetical protein